MEDADRIVHRGVPGALRVAVVELVQLCENDPGRDGRDEHQPLTGGADPARLRRARKDHLSEGEREGEAEHVCGEQRAPNQPTSVPARGATAVLEDAIRLVARKRHDLFMCVQQTDGCKLAHLHTTTAAPCLEEATVAFTGSAERPASRIAQ